jgi:hypothetical protein
MKTAVTLSIVLLSLLQPAVAQDAVPEAEPDEGIWREVLRLYEKAKQTGEQVPKDVYEWLRQEAGTIGDWEYRVVEMKEADAARTEARLNELGAERWECIWIQTVGRKTRFILKRPAKNYLGQIPLSQLMKLIGGRAIFSE